MLNIAMKKTLKLGFGRRSQQHNQIFQNLLLSLVRIKLHTKNQPPSFLNSEDSYEEDLKFGF